VRRQELTADDVQSVAVWEFTLREKVTGPNEGELRARPTLGSFDHAVVLNGGTVRARVTLADGRELLGILSPVHRSVAEPLRQMQPAVLTPSGQVHFWLAHEPTREEVEKGYELLDADAETVFPVSVQADVPLAEDYIGHVTVTGFCFVEYFQVPLGGGLKRGEFRFGEVR
jgi:hypothetical protein